MPEFKAVIRKALKVHMAEADMNPGQLAEASGVSVDAIRQYLRGETVPLMETTCKLAEALNCTPNDLCGFGTERGCA
ncbi:helix-turn-helix domain-containing protein [Adlercreutzia rubneri]